MDVIATDSFGKSLRKLINTGNWWRWEFYEDKYYDLKWILWAIKKYFKIVITMRPWDGGYILKMLRFQIDILREYLETKGIEVDESRLPKIERMKKFIELADDKIEDNYAERCGYVHFDITWEECKDDKPKGCYQMVVLDKDKEQDDKNTVALKKGHELEEKEYKEMFEILGTDMRGWWD